MEAKHTEKRIAKSVASTRNWLSEEQYQALLDRIGWDIACRLDNDYRTSLVVFTDHAVPR